MIRTKKELERRHRIVVARLDLLNEEATELERLMMNLPDEDDGED